MGIKQDATSFGRMGRDAPHGSRDLHNDSLIKSDEQSKLGKLIAEHLPTNRMGL